MNRSPSPTRRGLRPMGMITNNSEFPAVNFRTAQRCREQFWRSHVRNLESVRSNIDNKMISYPHVAADVKGQQNRAEQAARIQHDNEILLRKLQFVARPRPPSIELQYTVKPGIRLAACHQPKLDIEKTESRICAEPLALRTRRNELTRIAAENKRIGTRIALQKGFYPRAQFDKFASDQDKLRERCSKFHPNMPHCRSSAPSSATKLQSAVAWDSDTTFSLHGLFPPPPPVPRATSKSQYQRPYLHSSQDSMPRHRFSSVDGLQRRSSSADGRWPSAKQPEPVSRPCMTPSVEVEGERTSDVLQAPDAQQVEHSGVS